MNAPLLITRGQALEELERIMALRATEFPRLVAAGKLAQADADRFNDRLAAAWSYLAEPELLLVGPGHRATFMELVEQYADARNPFPKGGRK